jgi:hypothetical protein
MYSRILILFYKNPWMMSMDPLFSFKFVKICQERKEKKMNNPLRARGPHCLGEEPFFAIGQSKRHVLYKNKY